MVFKPIIDSRNHGNYISIHNKNTYEAFTVSDEINVLNKSKKYQVEELMKLNFWVRY
jgi:thymidine kinase